MPNENKAQGEKVYQKVRTGFNAEGLEYADYKATYTDGTTGGGVFLDVIRYFFRDGKLVKIYAGQYSRKGGVISGTRSIIDVSDFQATADTRFIKAEAAASLSDMVMEKLSTWTLWKTPFKKSPTR